MEVEKIYNMTIKEHGDRMASLAGGGFLPLQIMSDQAYGEIIFLSDRFGEFTDVDELRSLTANVEAHEAVFAKMESVIQGISEEKKETLLGMMREETTFIVMKDDQLGIMFEREFRCLEDEWHEDENEARHAWEGVVDEPAADNVLHYLSEFFSYLPLICERAETFVTQGAHMADARAGLVTFLAMSKSTEAELDLLEKAFLSPEKMSGHIEHLLLMKEKEKTPHRKSSTTMGL